VAAGVAALDGAVVVCKCPEAFVEAAAGFVVSDDLAGISAFGFPEVAGTVWASAVAEEFLAVWGTPIVVLGFGAVFVVATVFADVAGFVDPDGEAAGALGSAGGLSGTDGRRSARMSAAR